MRFTQDEDREAFELEESVDRRIRNATRPPLPPKQFRVQKAQNGIRFFAADRDRLAPEDGRLSSSVRYRVRWAQACDTNDTDKIEAAFVRSTIIGTIEGTGKEGVEASCYVVDPMYGTGYYFCTGVDGDGLEGEEYSQPVRVTSQILDDSIPGDPTHVQVTESGAAHNDVVYSEISVSCRAPNPLTSFAGVQLFLRYYQDLNSLVQEGYVHNYSGPAGGSINFKVTYPVCRRRGTGTISATNGSAAVTGSAFLTQSRAGDQIEILGVRSTIQSVNSDTSITLTANWTGRTVAAFTDYNIIGKIEVYLVAISRGGTHRFDWQNAPMVAVLFDGDLSAPNAPSIAATAEGNDVRIDLTPVVGTKIDRYVIYRGTGAAVAFSSCEPIKTIAADTNNTNGLLQWVDSKFSYYEREQGQTFSYYATAVNVADQESAASTRAEASCRLDAAGDNAPPVNAREIAKNILWNGMLGGTAGGNVVLGDAAQDTMMGGGAAPAGFNRWFLLTAGAGNFPTFQNATEVLLSIGGGAGAAGTSAIAQDIDAWDHATPGNHRIPKGKTLVFQVKLRTSGGQPDGTVYIDIEQYNGGALGPIASVRNRLSDDTYDYSATSVPFDGADLDATDYQIIWGVFVLDTTATTTKIRARVFYSTNNYNGVDVYITEAMLSVGETLPAYTPEHVDANITYDPPTGGAPLPPPEFDPEDGGLRGLIKMV